VIWATASGKGAPGATTLAVLLAWRWPDRERSRIVIEADPEGGVLAARGHDSSGLTHEPGLLSLAAARDGSTEARLHQHAQALGDGVELVAGPPGPAQAEACLRALGEPAVGAIRRAELNVVVDCGRLHPNSPALPWARAAERTLLVVRPRLDEVVALRPVAERLSAAGVDVGLVCIGDRPFDPVEVAEQATLPLLGVVPDDPAAAAAVTGRGLGDRRLRRSGLVRAVERLAVTLAAEAAEVAQATEATTATEATVEAPAGAHA
jgi:MinD-like ATPase involved in chromosome partitioning or flagellar assembly